MDEIANLMARNGLLPHGYCFQWSPDLLWTLVTSDLAIALAYFSIPLAILAFVRRRPEANVGGVASLFGAFIFACGVTHVLDVWTIWQPDYALQAASKAATALISVFTAIAVWRLLPRALAMPSAADLRNANSKLQAEAARRTTAEDRLLELEQHLSATLAAIGAGFMTTDAQGRVTRMNPVAEDVTGWSAADGTGRSVWEVFDRLGRPLEMLKRNPVDVLVEQGRDVEQAQHVICAARNGSLHPVELHAQVTRSDDGAVRGMTLIFRDESRLSRAEADSRRLAAVVESSSDAIITKTLDGRITDWNAAAERMFGYTAAEAIGQRVQMLIPHERESEEMRILSDLERGVTVPPFRTVRLAKDGRRIDVSVQISPVRDASGRVIGGAKSARDLTHQRQIEYALQRSESRMRFALETAMIGDWELDVASGAIYRSLRHDRCFGYAQPLKAWTREQLLGAVLAEDRSRVEASLHDAIEQRSAWHAEFRVLWPDDSTHWLRMDAQWISEGPLDSRMVGIVSDVTALRSADEARATAERLEAENRQVVEMSRLKSEFLANMSHELRTPLNAVIGFADLLRMGAVPAHSPKGVEYLGHIATSGRHLLQLINDVLDLSKIEAGRLDFAPSAVELSELVDGVVATLHVQAAAGQLQVTSSIAPDLHGLRLDPNRLRQVLFNYLSNAIKFTPPGGRVEIRAFGEGPWMWRLEVADTGQGIAEADLPRLFVEFQQLEASLVKRHQGTGLGLALTRRLVEAQGGRVGVYSTPGDGSLFYAVLPRDAADADAEGRPRVLVAAYDHSLRDGLARALARDGVAHDAAGSAAEVARLARVRRYHAITMDLTLPDADAPLVIQHLREEGAGAPIKALTLSVPRSGSVAYAVADVIHKPIDLRLLAQAWGPLRERIGKTLRVMVVDDDAASRGLMQAALDTLGIESQAVDGGLSALAVIDTVAPDAMVLDLMMPGMDGIQVLHALRALPRWRDLPVFVWTAATLSRQERQLLSASARAIIAKNGLTLDAVAGALLQWSEELGLPYRATGKGGS